MQEESIVREIEISDGQQVYKASYFVELGVLHANIGDKMVTLVLGGDTSEETVRRLLIEQMQSQPRPNWLADRWAGQSDA